MDIHVCTNISEKLGYSMMPLRQCSNQWCTPETAALIERLWIFVNETLCKILKSMQSGVV
jgi:hypothetical protein